jgi:hypothetical protein
MAKYERGSTKSECPGRKYATCSTRNVYYNSKSWMWDGKQGDEKWKERRNGDYMARKRPRIKRTRQGVTSNYNVLLKEPSSRNPHHLCRANARYGTELRERKQGRRLWDIEQPPRGIQQPPSTSSTAAHPQLEPAEPASYSSSPKD